jgi:hypothetical protein
MKMLPIKILLFSQTNFHTMEFKDIISVTGMSGLFKAGNPKGDGLIVTNLEDNKSTFVSSRNHGVTALENISVFREHDETIELRLVFAEMLKQEAENPPVDVKSAPEELKKYFKKIIPDYDEQRVHQSDMKKMIRWFHILKANNLIKTAEEIKAAETPAESK